MFEKVTVGIHTRKSIAEAWNVFTRPEYITMWNFASQDWWCPKATNNLVTNGEFNYRMESRDGKVGFDFSGRYTDVILHKRIEYVLGDDRTVNIEFLQTGKTVTVQETFDAETQNPVELQKSGWQSILDNYKRVLEGTE